MKIDFHCHAFPAECFQTLKKYYPDVVELKEDDQGKLYAIWANTRLPIGKRWEPAGDTHATLALDTNDFSSQVGKLHGPKRPSPHPGEVGDTDSA